MNRPFKDLFVAGLTCIGLPNAYAATPGDPSRTEPAAASAQAASTGAQQQEPADDAQQPLTKLPALRNFVQAEYPSEALAGGIEAVVTLLIDIDASGRVTHVDVLDSGADPAYGFGPAAQAAAGQLLFDPAETANGPLPVQISYKYRFELKPAEISAEGDDEAPIEPSPPLVNLQGQVVERGTRRLLAGVLVTVLQQGAADQPGFEARTDKEGRFEFFDLPPGGWEVSVQSDGYLSFRTEEQIVADERVEAKYYLERSSYGPFDVLVEGRRPRKEVSRTSLTVSEIERVPGTVGDAIKVVQNLPSVARSQAFSGNIIVRGAAPEDTRVFVAGAEVPIIYHFGGLRSVVPAGLLSGIDFYPGNFSVYYGRAIGGILDVRPARLQPERVRGYADVSLLDAGFLVQAPIGDKGAVAFSARRSYVDLFLEAFIPDELSLDLIAAPRYYDYQTLLSYRPTTTQEVKLLYFGSDDRLRLLFDNPSDLDAGLGNGDFKASTRFYRILIEHRYVPNERFQNEIRAAAGRNWIRFSGGDALQFRLNFYTNQIRDTIQWRIAEPLTLRAGVDMAFSKTDARIALPSSGSPREGELAQPGDFSNIAGTRAKDAIFFSPAAFAELQIRPTQPLLLVAGTRVDAFSRIDEVTVDPRLTARLDLGAWTLKGGVGLFHQEPSFDETDEVFGNPELGTERATHYSAGVEVRPRPYLTLDVTGFYKTLDNLVSRAPADTQRRAPDGRPSLDNGGSGRVYGMEVLLRHELARNFFGWLTYTLSRAERRDSAKRGYRLFDFDQTHILTLLGTYRLPDNWEVGARWRLVTGNPTTPVRGAVFAVDQDRYLPVPASANSARLPSFHQLDLRVDKRWVFDQWLLSVYLDVQNVYNRANAEQVAYNFDYSQSKTQGALPILAVIGVRAEL